MSTSSYARARGSLKLSHLPLGCLQRDAFLARLHLAGALILVVLSDVYESHALELAYVHELHLTQLA